MEKISFLEGLDAIFNFGEPWQIEDVAINHKIKEVEIKFGYPKGTLFECPECEKKCKVHDSSFKLIRHLDLFEYRCHLNVKIPRTKCNVHGIKTIINLPMMRNGSHFSFFLQEN